MSVIVSDHSSSLGFVPSDDTPEATAVPGAALYLYDHHGNAILAASQAVPCFTEIILN